ncbi:MAG: hypothetical protein HKN20_05665 [Gemmatimonadetes bacterium]|nr:hypothetical protein [Gemmatimonadota bacterium]
MNRQLTRGAVQLAAKRGISPPENAEARLGDLIKFIRDKGEKIHLFSKRDLDPERLVENHIYDAIAGLAFAAPKEGARVVDFGAGSGIVAMTWKILRPDLEVALLESHAKKCYFMTRAVEALKLWGTEVWEGRGENLEEARLRWADLVISRGVPSSEKNLRTMELLLRPLGEVLFFKGPDTMLDLRRRIEPVETLALDREEKSYLTEDKLRYWVIAVRVV